MAQLSKDASKKGARSLNLKLIHIGGKWLLFGCNAEGDAMNTAFAKIIAGLAALSLVTAAQANTRAGDSGASYSLPASVQAASFPQSSWLIPDEDDTSSLWYWLAGGGTFFLLLSTVISNEPDGERQGPNNGSNGAN